MTDKELLEAAAKAAGYEQSNLAVRPVFLHGDDVTLMLKTDRGGDMTWNPLEDDADALRLAVKLRMDVETSLVRCETVCADVWDDGIEEYRSTQEPFGTDPLAATRRAIVRAAASIGEALCRT